MERKIRIGSAAGFWGDSAIAVPQLLGVADLDYLVFDYLAETTMAILQRARMKNPTLGYATDFVGAVIAPYLSECMRRKVRIVANAGGLNPASCKEAVRQAALKLGLEPRIAIVLGDDILDRLASGEIRAEGGGEFAGGTAAPQLLSANAYLGAKPIAAALAAGADVVITGRCVDSAVTLGVAAFEFDWSWQDWDRLAQGSLAGHLIECGAQATGGLFTDWEQVPDWANIGYPYVDLHADGSFELGKPEGTGGLVNRATVGEQLIYEIGDPASYLLPDVICDFRNVRIEECGPQRVRVTGARGRPPTPTYKVSATWQHGYHLQIMMSIRGMKVAAKARRTADELLARTRRQMSDAGFGDYLDVCVELLGHDSHYPPSADGHASREVVLRMAVHHTAAKALRFLQTESTTVGASMGPGSRSNFGGRAKVQPVVKLLSFLVAKSSLQVRVECGGETMVVDDEPQQPQQPQQPAVVLAAVPEAADPASAGATAHVPLVRLAWARSGDKGDDVNIGVLAREPRFLPWIRAALSEAKVKALFSHLVAGTVERYELPGLDALNFVLHQALGGGGTASLRSDPLGKSFAQILLELPVAVPVAACTMPAET